MTWRMPAETEPQERVWMAFPPESPTVGTTAGEVAAARRTWTEVAHAALAFEPVTMVVDPRDLHAARALLSTEVELVEAPLDDCWMRDIGLPFVLDEQGRLGGVDWVFNGWGQQDWARWDHDARIGTVMAEAIGCARIGSDLVNEGGGIHVDGQGTVLLTETVQLDPGRNSDLTKADVEAELARTIGTTHAIWLRRGLARDSMRFGTRGHVDILATIASPGVVLVHDQRDPAHPDHEVSAEIADTLTAATDAAGRAFDVRPLPAPEGLRDAEGWVDHSYVNHLVVNGGVIACSFDDPVDAEAAEVLADAYPGRQVVAVDAREIFTRGGGIHCITQQQPRSATDSARSEGFEPPTF